jgi:hypothetical protein
MLFFSKPAPPLTKIQAPTAAEVCQKFKPQPAAQALLKPEQTPGQYLQVLEKNKMGPDSVNLLAHGMPERESVWWSCQSSQQVAGKLNAPDRGALAAAEAWVKNPTPETKLAAAAAAAKTDMTGPGAWAAQAAAWTEPPAPAIPGAPAPPSGLAAPAVAGSVMLAAGLVNRPAMPESPAPKQPVLEVPTLAKPELATPVAQAEVPPVDQNKQAKMLQPFVDLGKDVASGQNTWA